MSQITLVDGPGFPADHISSMSASSSSHDRNSQSQILELTQESSEDDLELSFPSPQFLFPFNIGNVDASPETVEADASALPISRVSSKHDASHFTAELTESESDFEMTLVDWMRRIHLRRFDWALRVHRSELEGTVMDKDSGLQWFDTCWISNLSVELLIKIFVEACQYDSLTYPRSTTALAICLACRRWRNIILETREPWSSFSLIINPGYNSVFNDVFPLLSLYLSRSRNMPISFEARLIGEQCRPLLSVLWDQAARWENVSISVSSLLWGGRTNVDFSRLKTFRFAFTDMAANPQISRSGELQYLGYAPSLHTFTLCSPLPMYWPIDIKLSPIVNFATLGMIPLFLAIAYIREFPFVETFTFVSKYRDGQRSSYSLPTLRAIRFKKIGEPRVGREALQDFISALTLPSASSIAIELPNWERGDTKEQWLKDAIPWPHQEFVSLIQRSACPLQELVLSNVSMTAVQLCEILEALPRLEILEFNEPPVFSSGVLVTALTRPDPLPTPHSTLVPMLTHLKLSGHLSFADDDFVEMLESRIRFKMALARVDIVFRSRGMQNAPKRKLFALATGVLEISVCHT